MCGGDEFLGTRAVALKCEVSESWIRRVKQERREQENLGPATKHRPGPSRRMQFD